MKLLKSIALLCLAATSLPAIAQDKQVLTVDLNEVVVKNRGPQSADKRIKAQNVHFRFQKGRTNYTDSTGFITRFPAFDSVPIRLSSIELKLKPFDSSVLRVELMILQLNGTDTVLQQIPIAASEIDRHNKLKLYVADYNILLQPAPLYLGYRFIGKQIPDQGYDYRVFCTDKGEGAIIYMGAAGWTFTTGEHVPYIFPFRIAYFRQ